MAWCNCFYVCSSLLHIKKNEAREKLPKKNAKRLPVRWINSRDCNNCNHVAKRRLTMGPEFVFDFFCLWLSAFIFLYSKEKYAKTEKVRSKIISMIALVISLVVFIAIVLDMFTIALKDLF